MYLYFYFLWIKYILKISYRLLHSTQFPLWCHRCQDILTSASIISHWRMNIYIYRNTHLDAHHTYTHTHAHSYTRMYTYTCPHVHTYENTYTFTHTLSYTDEITLTYPHTHAYIHMCAYTLTCTISHVHTHTHQYISHIFTYGLFTLI